MTGHRHPASMQERAEPRDKRDVAIAAARLALARIANGDPQAMRLAKTALADIETLVGPAIGGGR